MRLLLRYNTGNANHLDEDLTAEQVRKIFSSAGWIPKNSELAKNKLEKVLNDMPDTIRDEIMSGEPLAIMPLPGLWGIVSSETHNQLYIRLISNDFGELQRVADKVVDEFPGAFRRELDRNPGPDPQVAIRRFDSEIRIVVGTIVDHLTTGFWRYSRTQRRRESLVALSFLALTVLSIGLSALIFRFTNTANWDYWRGYLDRGGTAFFAASLTTLINLYFEYRNWRIEKRHVNWTV